MSTELVPRSGGGAVTARTAPRLAWPATVSVGGATVPMPPLTALAVPRSCGLRTAPIGPG